MIINVEEVKKIISSKESSDDSGTACNFFKINDKLGLKLYTSISSRDKHWNNQVRASKVNLGPETYGTIDNVTFGGSVHEFFGYFKEIVEVRDYSHSEQDKNFQKVYDDEILDLRNALNQIGFEFCDFHSGNCGIKNGKLICVDFGC